MSNNGKFFSSGGAALQVINNTLEGAREVRIATAFFEPGGFEALLPVLRGRMVKLLLGRQEGAADRARQALEEFISFLSDMPGENRTAAMMELRDALKQGVFHLSVSDSSGGTALTPRYLYQHAKLYIADRERAVITSANCTASGLIKSREAGVEITDREDVGFFVDRFDQYYAKARPVGEELLAILEEWLRIHPPATVYLRSLLELYAMDEDYHAGTLPALAAYQKPVVSRLVHTMEMYGGAMLVASTGLGKTIMAAHLLAWMRMQGDIDRVIVLCPAGLKGMWRRTMRAARISSEEFSYYLLSVDDWQRYRDVSILDNELKTCDDRTLVILDESHHMRNAFEKGELRGRNRKIMEAVEKGTRILLMTATPYSRDVVDINNQLRLLPPHGEENRLFGETHGEYWSVETPDEMRSLEAGAVLTTPSVVRYYSERDERGLPYVLFSGDQKRYFPVRLNLRMISYDNPLDDLLVDLLNNGLLYRKMNEEYTEGLFKNNGQGRRDPLLEARLVNQFCSSPAEVDLLMGKMSVEGGFERLRFELQDELSRWVALNRPRVQDYMPGGRYDDPKIEAAAGIIRTFPGERFVIFCHYHATAFYVHHALTDIFSPGLQVGITAGSGPDEIESIIDRFAPLANSVDLEEMERAGEDPIHILVATGALAEGFNFQDASVLINFDLPWTVLVLAQRMGRILRPWHEPRDVHIFNLVPSTMSREDIHHAMNWKHRLVSRGSDIHSLVEIPVITEHRQEYEMMELARSLETVGDASLELDEVLEFIESSDHLTSNSFIDTLARLPEEEKERILGLPRGFKSFKTSGGARDKLYLLLTSDGRKYPVLFNGDGSVNRDSESRDEIMSLIASEADEEAALPAISDHDLDIWISRSISSFAASRKLMPERIDIICAMVLS